MSKREFRSAAPAEARYPTFESFDRGCRDLLARLALGAALLGGGLLGGCGERTVPAESDAGVDASIVEPPSPGFAPQPPSPLDLLPPDAGRDLAPPRPDLPENLAGGAPMPPAPIDAGPGQD